jgi:carbonic anhydrase/acetyltransferase-like protein (isoleucine patch superfamily)
MIYEFDGIRPTLAEDCFVAPNASVIGRVEMRARSSVWFGAIVRGDNDRIVLGEDSNVQDNCVLHTDDKILLSIGDRVTVGHMAMLHGCTIGEESLIGIGTIVLNHAKVGAHTVLGANSLVTEGKVIPDGVLAMGAPAKVIRPLTTEELEFLKYASSHYVERAAKFMATLRAV